MKRLFVLLLSLCLTGFYIPAVCEGIAVNEDIEVTYYACKSVISTNDDNLQLFWYCEPHELGLVTILIQRLPDLSEAWSIALYNYNSPGYDVPIKNPVTGEPYFAENTTYMVTVALSKDVDYAPGACFSLYFAVDNNTTINTLVLPENLEIIESEAFAGIGANKVIIGEHVSEIQDRAFADIDGVFYADFETKEGFYCEFDDKAFENTTTMIYCYYESVAMIYADYNYIARALKD